MRIVLRLHAGTRHLRIRSYLATRFTGVSRLVATTPRLLASPLATAIAVSMALTAIVVLTPRFVRAQAAPPTRHTVRHTLRGDVSAVTYAALSSPWRPSEREIGVLPDASALVHRSWMQRADVRSNVRTAVLLEPSVTVPGNSRGAWRVLDANGQLVPWQNTTVVLFHELAAGRHDVAIVWVAPPDAAGALPPAVRLQIVAGAR